MYRHALYLGGYLALILGVCINNHLAGKTLYQSLVGLVENRMQHFLLCSFFVFLVYTIGKILVNVFIGKLSSLEIEGVQENSLRYLGNICLVITLFADDISLKGLIVFSVVFGLKVVHWILGLRIETIEKSGGPPRKLDRLWELCGFLFCLNGLLMIKTLEAASKSPGVCILFAFEFSLLFAYSIRAMYSLFLLFWYSSLSIESKIFMLFYGDLAFGVFRISAHILCLVWTTIHFRMPINLLRESILITKNLILKIKSVLAYKHLLTQLEGCPDVTKDALSENKTCLICHEDMEVAKRLECSHVFHLNCLKEWLHRQQACPVCRKEVLVKSAERAPTEEGSVPHREPRSAGVYFRENNNEYEGVPVMLEDDL